MMQIEIVKKAGKFAENKDIAKEIRIDLILPALEQDKNIILDFSGVTGTTQSFIHALISDVIRKQGSEVLDRIDFKSCNEVVQKIISMVVDYMQDGIGDD
jgi:nucleoside-triphosphatase THEP1